jgi:hypothetical protein
MINIQQFKQLEKNSSQSYHQQKKFIKKVLSGQILNCEVCGQKLTIYLPEQHEISGIRCAKGCTNIELDFS